MFNSKKIYQGKPSTTLAPIAGPVAQGEKLIIKSIIVNNTAVADESFLTIAVADTVENAADSANAFINKVKYAVSEKENISSGNLYIVVEEGETIYAKQTVEGAISLYISGITEK